MIAASTQIAPPIISTPVATNASTRSISSSRTAFIPAHEEPELRMHDARHVVDRTREQARPIGLARLGFEPIS